MKKKVLVVLLSVAMIAVLCTGCNKNSNVESIATPAVDEPQINDTQTENRADSEAENSNETIQAEMEAVEATYQDMMNSIDSATAPQQVMNQNAAACYQLWDDELNSLWDRLSDEVDAKKKEDLLGEQRQWNEKKEIEIKNAGEECEGGSLQPLLECGKGTELTRSRCYYLAGLLAEVRGEGFVISDEVQAELDAANPTLDEVFMTFEGQWFFDVERGAVIGIEQTAECEYGVPGSTWTVWVTGGDLLSDLDVIDYTSSTIDFMTSNGAYYQLGHTMAGGVSLDYGTTRGEWTETTYAN